MVGERVRVHYNIRKRNYTICRYIKGVGWRKASEANSLMLRDVTFKVSQAGRMRAIRQGRRNVHAYAYGFLLHSLQLPTFLVGSTLVTYNPFKYEHFVTAKEGLPVYEAQEVLFSVETGVQAWGIVC